jgi:hypothetical protein
VARVNVRLSTFGSCLLALSIARAGGEARMPGPWPIVRAHDAISLNAQCEACHSSIAREWRGSSHHEAFTDPSFQKALAKEPVPFCRGCHAPEAPPSGPTTATAEIGVACVTCHVLDRAPLAIPRAAPLPSAHPIAREPRFASADACARCHEFDFPDRDQRLAPLAMQRTVSEHRASPAADKRCAACHMPIVDGRRSHRFLGGRDPDFVRSAVEVVARRAGSEIHIEVRATAKLGHAFPTGDLFRRMIVRVHAGGTTTTKIFARRFGPREELPGKIVRAELADDRVTHARPAVVGLHAPGPARYEVVYQRVQALLAPDGHDAEIAGETILAAGEL